MSRRIGWRLAGALWVLPALPSPADETAAELKTVTAGLRVAAVESNAVAGSVPVDHQITVGHLIIHVRPNFRDAYPYTVMKVLQTASDPLLKHVPEDHAFPPLAVEYNAAGPMIFYERSRENPSTLVLRLSAQGAFWAQYVFQYAHELCHLIQNTQTQGPDQALFFYESLAHLASHYVLRTLAVTWKTAPSLPGEGWTGFAPHLREYSDALAAKHRLPEGQTLEAWYAEHRAALHGRCSSDLRPAYETIALALLPFFENEPDNWEAVTYLGRRRPERNGPMLTFEEVLAEWRAACPERHRPLVDRIAAEFGAAIP